MEQKLFIFHFWWFPFTKRFHFCFETRNNFQSERKSGKLIIFGIENSAHVVKSCDGFIFWTFHEPLVKHLRGSMEFSNVNLARENLGWDEHGNFTFADENHQNASRREIFLPNRLWNPQNITQNTILSHFSPNPIRMPSRFAQNSLIFRDECVSGSFLSILHETLLKRLRDLVQNFIEILG